MVCKKDILGMEKSKRGKGSLQSQVDRGGTFHLIHVVKLIAAEGWARGIPGGHKSGVSLMHTW